METNFLRLRTDICTTYWVITVLLVSRTLCAKYITVDIEPSPATIYSGAPIGTFVAKVNSQDEDGNKPTSYELVTPPRTFFTITEDGVIRTSKEIQSDVGSTTALPVYVYYDHGQRDVILKVRVTQENIYPPVFDKAREEYNFLIYRYEPGVAVLGQLKSKDNDTETYNRDVRWSIDDPEVTPYLSIASQTGILTIEGELMPKTVTYIRFTLRITNNGSPPLSATARSVLTVTDLAPPSILCVHSDVPNVRVCWRNPIRGNYVDSYTLNYRVNSGIIESTKVLVEGTDAVSCTNITVERFGDIIYLNTVLFNGSEWSAYGPQEDFQILTEGWHTGERSKCDQFTACEIFDYCYNGGTCSSQSIDNYECACPTEWKGQQCLDYDVCSESPCQNGGNCSRCESRIDPCLRSECLRTEKCIPAPESDELYVCRSVSCQASMTADETGFYKWPMTSEGNTAILPCGNGSDSGKVYRYCSTADVTSDPLWGIVETRECVLIDTELAEAAEAFNNLLRETDDSNRVDASLVNTIADTLHKFYKFALQDREIAKTMVSVVSNVLMANDSVLVDVAASSEKGNKKIWKVLNSYTEETNDDSELKTENVNLLAVDVNQNRNEPVTYDAKFKGLDDDRNDGAVSITIPSEAVQIASNGSEVPVRAQLMAFRSSGLFIPNNMSVGEDIRRQKIVVASIKGRKVSNLTSPVIYSVPNIEMGRNHSCVYWDDEEEAWMSDGVMTEKTGGNMTTCHSTHMTSFAVLLDPTPEYQLSAIHEQILTYISYIGAGISMVSLAFTIMTYCMFRCLNREKTGKILINLCIALLLLNTAFIVGAETSSQDGKDLCTVIAVVLHYFLLATLTWMLVEAVNMYQALVNVFTRYSGHFILKRCIFAWGFPVVIVAITLGINVDHYRSTRNFCFLSSDSPYAYYAAILVPACIVLALNTFIFIRVSLVILKPKFKGNVTADRQQLTPAQVRGAFTVLVLVGVTWVFGPLAIGGAKLVLNYLFCILNSLQGFLIFVFRCFFNPEVRLAWIQLIKTGTFKTRRGPIKSVTDTSKSNSHNSYAESETYKTNLNYRKDSAVGNKNMLKQGNLHNNKNLVRNDSPIRTVNYGSSNNSPISADRNLVVKTESNDKDKLAGRKSAECDLRWNDLNDTSSTVVNSSSDIAAPTDVVVETEPDSTKL